MSKHTHVGPIDYIAVTTLEEVPETVQGYRVIGHCLEPEITEGDCVLVDTDMRRVEPVSGDLVLCVRDNKISLKRLRTDYNGNRWLEDGHGTHDLSDYYI